MADRAYSRVYHEIVDDPKFATIFDNDRRLATWLRLLLVADQAYPASAYLPAGTHRDAINALSDAGLIDLGTGSRFRIHGLDAERSRRSEWGKAGAAARWSESGRNATALRAHSDRTAVPMQDETRLDETRRVLPPTPSPRGSRTNGTNPRAVARRAERDRRLAEEAIRQRYYQGEIVEAEMTRLLGAIE